MSDSAESVRLVRQERVQGRMYDLYEGHDTIEVFVDGSSGAMISPAVCRMQFHTVIDVEKAADSNEVIERRELKLKVVIPTPQFVEFLLNTLSAVAQNNEALLAGVEDYKQTLIRHLKRVKSNE